MAALHIVDALLLLSIVLTTNLAHAYIATEYVGELISTIDPGDPSFSIAPAIETYVSHIVPTVTPVPSPTAEITTVSTIPSLGGLVTVVSAVLPPAAGVSPAYTGSRYEMNYYVEFTYTACTAFPTVVTLVTQYEYRDPIVGILKPTIVAPIQPLPSSAAYFLSGDPVTASFAETDLPDLVSRSWKYTAEPTACYDMIYTPAPTAPAAAARCSFLPLSKSPDFRCGGSNPCCNGCDYWQEQELQGFEINGAVQAEWYTCPDGNAYFANGNASDSNLNGRPPSFLSFQGPVTPTSSASMSYGYGGSGGSGGSGGGGYPFGSHRGRRPSDAAGMLGTLSITLLATSLGVWAFLMSAI